MQLHGDDDGEAFNTIFPTTSRAVHKDEWLAMFGIPPMPCDEATIGSIVSFVMAARNLLIEDPLAERTRLLKLLIEARTEMRGLGSRESTEFAPAKRVRTCSSSSLAAVGSGSRTNRRRKP